MKNFKKFFVGFMLIFCVISYGAVFATGEPPEEVNEVLGSINQLLAAIAGFVCLAKVIQIGISYMLTGAGGKGQAKTSIWPWMAGTLVCASYFTIGRAVINKIQDAAGNGGVLDPASTDKIVDDVVNPLGYMVLGYFSMAAGAAALGVLIWIGVKYMTSGAVERAQVKNTLLPWLIGLLIASSASAIMQLVISAAPTTF